MAFTKNNKRITKIVITGGPCAGKTTGMQWIRERITELGYSVVFIPETATELISGGVAPWTMNTVLDYQLCQMKLQSEKEKIFAEAASKLGNSDKILLVCDRGAMDNKAYMTENDFYSALSLLSLREEDMLNEYDAVFHLATAAKGGEEFYTLSNNEARTESVDEAVLLDEKLISAWKSHPHFKLISEDRSFENKMEKLVFEISEFLKNTEREA